MTGIAIMGIMGAVAAPSFSDLIDAQRAKGAASDIFTSLLRTRSEAIKRNAPVTMTPAEGGWAAGWSVAHPTNDDVLLEDRGAVNGVTVSGPDSVTFLPNGRLSGSDAPAFDVAAAGADKHRCIEVDLSGRPYQTPEACPE
ncbi:GspH/FimT family pseudopilin [Massilia sp. R798]|uniref:Type II secretion system protein H n=2 Tax=Massilia soli TaxID=2792854 RepID=A0ABS7STX6_9BURK|nr:GspH/FimT family pseudopilin [Massilia soli]